MGQFFAANIGQTMGNLYQKLTHLRKEIGITQIELAEKIGCSNTTISRIERGERLPTPAMLNKILKCYKDLNNWRGDEYRKIYDDFQEQLTILTTQPEVLKDIAPSTAYNCLYSQAQMVKLESEVQCKEIWVISPDLSNDTGNPEENFIPAVQKNLKRKIIYTYIVPDTETVDAVLPYLKQIFTSHSEQLQVKKVSRDILQMLVTAHIVIYNPNMEGGHTPQIFIELPTDIRKYGKRCWINVDNDIGLKLLGRFRKLIEEI